MRSSNSSHRLRIIMSMLCLTVFFVSPLHAEPDQRLIIHFTHELTESHHKDIKIRLNNIIRSEYTLAEHSDNLRWIVILHHRINLQKIRQYKNELLKDKRIKEIELDTILNKKTLIQTQLLPPQEI